MTVAAIIPTIPGREDFLTEALDSVVAQTSPVDALQIEHDLNLEGPAVARNRAIERTDCEWLAFLDDDDIWYPHHIETLLAHSAGQDVVYTDCKLVGDHNGLNINHDFNADQLQVGNYIAVTTLVRRTAFIDAGMFDPDDLFEDWRLWQRMFALGATFLHVPVVTWEYRWHSQQRTRVAERMLA